MTKYVPERAYPRVVPAGSLYVSIFGAADEPASGSIANLSMGGAQVLTRASLALGERVLLRIAFEEDTPFSIPGNVVWHRDDVSPSGEEAYGVRFRIADPDQRARLEAVLASSKFVSDEGVVDDRQERAVS